MYATNGLRKSLPAFERYVFRALPRQTRCIHVDGRNRLSNFWAPTQAPKRGEKLELDSHDLLIRAGFLRQAHSGIFHLLPLGLRVQDKLERLIDKHMQSLGASKTSLSSLSSEELWRQSGRLEGRDAEFLRLQDRKGSKFLLSPTHEEEITSIVAGCVKSHKDLPLRLYQVSRKYRDEARPRQGLLRGREFLMKDLYTFDATEEQAQQTYDDVRGAYKALFDELNLPYLVANADSGNMGGSLSHEYHFASPSGEDTIITCTECDYSTNEELFPGSPHDIDAARHALPGGKTTTTTHFISKDGTHLYHVLHPASAGPLNQHLLKRLFPSLTLGIKSPHQIFATMNPPAHVSAPANTTYILDPRLPLSTPPPGGGLWPPGSPFYRTSSTLTSPSPNDVCPSCHAPTLKPKPAIEIAHTFHLGTRYSTPLRATITQPNNATTPVSMGCHGIGVSRLIGAAASLLATPSGLNWPLSIAPFSAVVVPTNGVTPEVAEGVYDRLCGLDGVDVVLDDRGKAFGWKSNDVELVGYPFVVVVGTKLELKGVVEVWCLRLGVRREVKVEHLIEKIAEMAKQL